MDLSLAFYFVPLIYVSVFVNRDQKKAGVAILISDKIDFKTKAVKRYKEGKKYTMEKRQSL